MPRPGVAAVVALGRIGDARATPALVAAARRRRRRCSWPRPARWRGSATARRSTRCCRCSAHRDAAVRQAAIGALNSIGHPEMPARIAELLTSDDPLVRESAVRIAGYFGYPETAAALLDAGQRPGEAVRAAALEHLPFLDDERVPPALIAALRAGHAARRAPPRRARWRASKTPRRRGAARAP